MLKRINNLLVAIIVGVNLYTIMMPIAPIITFWVKSSTSNVTHDLDLKISNPSIPAPIDNRLVIPRIMLDEPIYDGSSVATADKGIWRRPISSTPDQGGNTVLVGHRFTYRGPAIFYHLDLIEGEDEMAVFWQGKKYLYKVKEIKVVPPSDGSVEAPSSQNILTLYTCTPMWTSKNRLVVIAERITQ